MSELSVEVVGETEAVLAVAIELAFKNCLGGYSLNEWCVTPVNKENRWDSSIQLVDGLVFTCNHTFSAWWLRDTVNIEWNKLPAGMNSPSVIAAIAMAWLKDKDLVWPVEPDCDGSIVRAWRMRSDLDGTLTICPEWTEYHK